MASTDAIPVPRKNTAYRFYFAIRKPSDSTLITTWAGMDSEVSLDGAAFADCTNEATEIGTSGCGYIDLTSSEMNADSVVLKVTVTNTGAVPLVFTFLPESAGDYRVADTQKVDVDTIKTRAVTCAAGVTVLASVGTAATSTAQTGDTYALANGSAGFVAIDTVVDAIKVKTDSLTFTVAGDVDVNVQTWGGTAISTPPAVNASQFGGAAVTATTSVTIPAASTLATTTGAVGSVTGAVGSVTGAVGSVTGAVGSVTGNVGGNVTGNVTGSVGSVATGGIASTSFAAGAINAAAIANAAIDAATFAADVDAEFLSYIVDDATRIDASSLNTASVTSIPAILADTGTDGVVVAAGSKTGYTLTATTGLGNQTANLTGNLSGSVGSVTTGVNVAQWLGTAVATPSVAGVPEVDITHINGLVATGVGTPDVNVVSISGDTVAADNAEAFFDGTGYAGTNNVIPTVTTLTNLPAITSGWITATGIAADAIGADEISAAAAAKIADIVLRRTQTNVEASSFGDAVSLGCLYGLIQQAQESNTTATPGTLTVFKVDGSTSLGTKALTTNAAADPVDGIS